MSAPFRYRFRVRYHECDGQQVVFNARWGEYVDVAATEYTRVVFGATDALDWRLVRQVTEWRAPARFDQVLEAEVRTVRIGTTSFSLATRFVRPLDDARLVEVETVYVVFDPVAGAKRPVPAHHRAALEAGAAGVLIDATGGTTR